MDFIRYVLLVFIYKDIWLIFSRKIMLIKKLPSFICTPQPRSFAALMEMYELNYIRLRRLCGDIKGLQDTNISYQTDIIPVQLNIIDRASHTTTIFLTYLFSDKQRPDLRIRVYHDSKQAEVISRACQLVGLKNRMWQQDPSDSLLQCRWRLNRFLYKWLGYLQKQGHAFH